MRWWTLTRCAILILARGGAWQDNITAGSRRENNLNAFDLIQVVCTFAQAGQVLRNIYHLVSDGAINEDEVLPDVAEYFDELYDLIDAIQSDGLVYTDIAAMNLTTNVDYGTITWPTLTAGGLGAGGQLMTQAAGLLTLPTDIPRKRGRKYIPGLTEDHLSGGLFDSSVTNALGDIGDFLLQGHVYTAGPLWRYVVYGTTAAVTSARRPTAAIVTNVPSTLVRRRIGVGE